MNLYPLKFYPALVERVWGGTSLARSYAGTDNPNHIGEIWCIHGSLKVKNGSFVGRTLDEICSEYPESFFPAGYESAGREFPLLIKWLKAEHWLSVQVHPDDESAQALRGKGACGKTEAWYVVEAERDASLILDTAENVSADDVMQAKGPHVVRLLNFIYPDAGDAFLIESGKIHALGPGITVLEVQQNCDITYRIYDWDRLDLNGKARDLHLKEAEYVIKHKQSSRISVKSRKNEAVFPAAAGKLLALSRYFRMELLKFSVSADAAYCKVSSSCSWTKSKSAGAEILICTKGSFKVSFAGASESILCGEACVIPGTGNITICTCSAEAEAVRVIMPFA